MIKQAAHSFKDNTLMVIVCITGASSYTIPTRLYQLYVE